MTSNASSVGEVRTRDGLKQLECVTFGGVQRCVTVHAGIGECAEGEPLLRIRVQSSSIAPENTEAASGTSLGRCAD